MRPRAASREPPERGQLRLVLQRAQQHPQPLPEVLVAHVVQAGALARRVEQPLLVEVRRQAEAPRDAARGVEHAQRAWLLQPCRHACPRALEWNVF